MVCQVGKPSFVSRSPCTKESHQELGEGRTTYVNRLAKLKPTLTYSTPPCWLPGTLVFICLDPHAKISAGVRPGGLSSPRWQLQHLLVLLVPLALFLPLVVVLHPPRFLSDPAPPHRSAPARDSSLVQVKVMCSRTPLVQREAQVSLKLLAQTYTCIYRTYNILHSCELVSCPSRTPAHCS